MNFPKVFLKLSSCYTKDFISGSVYLYITRNCQSIRHATIHQLQKNFANLFMNKNSKSKVVQKGKIYFSDDNIHYLSSPQIYVYLYNIYTFINFRVYVY